VRNRKSIRERRVGKGAALRWEEKLQKAAVSVHCRKVLNGRERKVRREKQTFFVEGRCETQGRQKWGE